MFRDPVTLGRSNLRVGRLGIGASYGVPASSIERAFHEYGVNYLYWGSMRRDAMRQAIRNLGPRHRDKLVIALQTYDRTGFLMPLFFKRGLRALGIDYADVLILGFHTQRPARRILHAAQRLQQCGLVRHLAISGHRRTFFADLARDMDSAFDIFMMRYSAAHRGIETEVIPALPPLNKPGIIAYTATRWGHLLDPKRMPPGQPPLTASDCYRFVLSNPNVNLCLTGPKDDRQMNEALHALEAGPMSDDELKRARFLGDHVRQESRILRQ